MSRDPSEAGCIVGGRLIYSAMYHMDTGEAIIVWFDRAGNCTDGVALHADPERRIITTKPGEEIIVRGKRWKVASVEDYRETRQPQSAG